MPQDSPVVVTDKLTKMYDEFTALDAVSIKLNRGGILGIIGPNGAGKTTMIKILVGLARPTSGTARIAGADCMSEARKIKHLVGYMPDKFGSYDNMRVREYLDFFGAAFGLRRKERRKRIEAVLETTGSAYMQDRYVETLSHGMQQRVGIARTLIHNPQVLIFDEPANGLDPQARVDMRNLLLQLAQMGKTLIVTSHILPELSRICDQVAILTHGKLRAYGSLDDIMGMVSQKKLIETQLTTADQIEQAIAIIRPAVEEDAEITGSSAEATVRFQTSRSESELCELLAKLVRAGIHVSQFRELQTSLEDAFLSVTKNDGVQAFAASESPEAVQASSSLGESG